MKTKSPQIIVKYNKKEHDARCKCGGRIAFNGKGYYQIPAGFGSHPGDTGFYVDSIRINGHFGDCLDCHKRVLAYTSKKVVSKRLKLAI